jgi:hypothetical protein
MPKLRNIFFTLAGGALMALLPSSVLAQSLGQPDPVQYTVAPEIPGPNQLTSIKIEGVGNFIGNSTITWNVAGKTVQSGVGVSFFSFTTGGLGSETRVHVTIDSPIQGVITKDFVFDPSAVNLVWEGNTTVPPIYSGKALYSAGSNFKVAAFPAVFIKGSRVAAQSLSYQWSVNDDPQPDLSGTGRSTLTFAGDQLQAQERVSVDLLFGSRKVAHGEVVIPAAQPQILLYYKDPLRGVVWDNALPQAIQLTANEITIQAQPYYFANEGLRSGALQWDWTLNGNETTGPFAPQGQLTLRQSGSGTGAAVIGVSLQNNNPDQFVQAASTALQLVFGKNSPLSNLFGL